MFKNWLSASATAVLLTAAPLGLATPAYAGSAEDGPSGTCTTIAKASPPPVTGTSAQQADQGTANRTDRVRSGPTLNARKVNRNIDSVYAVISVADFKPAQSWYSKLFGRGPDVAPTEGIAEWQLTRNAWVQLTENPGRAGKSSVVIEVKNLVAQVKAIKSAGLSPGPIEEYPGIVKTSTILDPENNEISFVEDLTG